MNWIALRPSHRRRFVAATALCVAVASVVLPAKADTKAKRVSRVEAENPRQLQKLRGARVPWIEYEAEAGTTNGAVLSPSRIVGMAAAECSGRSGVTLSATGQFVAWKTRAKANALTIRLSIPDAPTGGGINSSLNLYVNGTFRRAIAVTSHFSWLYGAEDRPVNMPGGTARAVFDESSALIGDVPAGATLSLRKDSANTADYYTIDLIDLEQVPAALPMPENFVSIADFGATPDDDSDDTTAIARTYAHAKASGKGLWIPPGTFRQSLRLTVSDVAVRGAGIWYSKLLSHDPPAALQDNDTAGFWVLNNCQFSNFAIFGQLTSRGDFKNVSAFRGPFGAGSVVENIWGEHTECFAWVGVDSSKAVADGVIFRNNRIRNTLADGINFASGTRNSRMENNHARGTGDDSFAIFASPRTVDAERSSDNSIVNCTSQMSWRASGIGIYGGFGNEVDNCAVYDTLTYAGLSVQRGAESGFFGPEATTIKNVDLVRCGGTFWNNQQFGALWTFADTGTIDSGNILFQNVDIYDASYSGIQVQSSHNLNQSGITFDNVHIQGVETDGVFIHSGAIGSATFKDVTVKGVKGVGLKNDAPETYEINRETGNKGW